MTQCMRTTSHDVASAMPQALIEYLWNLAGADDRAEGHAFFLTKGQLGGRELQEILHVAEGGCEQLHKVFGFSPVEAVVQIGRRDGEPWMHLAGSLGAACLIGG